MKVINKMKKNILSMVGNGVNLINKTKTLVINGKKEDIQVYEINLNLLTYNTENGRISSQINEYEIEKNCKIEEKCNDNQIEVNDLIEKFIIDSNKKAFTQTKNNIYQYGQTEPGVILYDGTVIDGNRRFTCLRVIEKESGKIESNFFEAAVLEKNVSKKEIKKLELQLQHAREEKVDYDVIDKIIDVYNNIIKSEEFTVEEYSLHTGWKKGIIQEYIGEYELISDYLESINSKDKIYLAKNWKLQGPMREIWLILKKINDKSLKNEIKNILFNIIKCSKDGDLTREVRDYGEYLKNIETDNNEDQIKKIIENLTKYDADIEKIWDYSLELNENIKNLKVDNTSKKFKDNIDIYLQKEKFKTEKKLEAYSLESIYENINSIDINKIKISSDDTKREIIDICEKIENKIKEIKQNAQ